MKRMKKWCADNKVYLVAFFAPVIAMLVIFIGDAIYPFGDRSFLHIDMYHQYFPMLTDFYRAVRGSSVGTSLFYSWSAGLGSNFIAEYAYYLASPLNWLCIFFKEEHLIEFMSYMVILKMGGMSVCFSYYLSKHFNTKSMSVVFFGIFYAMSGFIAAYNWDVMWLDVVMFAPLVILGLELLVSTGKYKLYTITLGLSILSNYYLCIMLCIYLVLYFLCVLLPAAENKVKSMWNFAKYSVIGGGMAAVLLVPEVLALQLSKFSASSFPTKAKSYFALFDVLARHLCDVEVETALNHWPNIYCSVAVLFLIPLYIICKEISAREKIGKLCLLVFFLISFSSNVMAYLWHGLNYPDSLPARQSYLYILLLLTVCYEALMHIREFQKSEICGTFAAVVIFIVLCQKLVTDDALTGRSYVISALLVVVYAILVFLYCHKKTDVKTLTYVVLAVTIIEAGINMMLTSVPTVSRDAYLSNYDTYNTLFTEHSELDDGKLYRFENSDNRVRNDDSMLQNYMSTSLFSSTANGLVNAFYANYGMRSSKVFYCADGMTPFMSGILSNKYLYMTEPTNNDSLKTYTDAQNDVYLYEYNKSLPLGYMLFESDEDTSSLVLDEDTAFELIDGDIKDADGALTPVERQNELVEKLGVNKKLYSEVDSAYSANDYTYYAQEDGYYVAFCDTKKISTIVVETSEETYTYKKTKNPYILELGYLYRNDYARIYDEELSNDLHLNVYKFNEEVYNEVMDKLGRETLNITDFEADMISGDINVSDKGYLVMSIPYDPGWKVYVDGVDTQVYLFSEMMISFPLNVGAHVVTMKYRPQGLLSGALLSVLFISLFVIICYRDKKRIGNSNV